MSFDSLGGRVYSEIKPIIEAALFVANRPLSIDALQRSVLEPFGLNRAEVRAVLTELETDYTGRGVQLVEVASGFRFQAKSDYATILSRLWEEKVPKYSRATLETLSLIVYRQPITRGEIEEIRGVSVGSNIIKSLLERNWIKIVGHKEVPGRPALYATTQVFLDDFAIQSIADLPPLPELNEPDQNESSDHIIDDAS
ncbi:SMC-Scp complex subunit ScpB [Algicola sagamiensis]|uniref:SMC-Scp complex subunit ScpB n=1 Tax=Algicola sagamiensis TaxID=163869 RepID=UPI00035C1AAF|nr:SMC-Scp complex subunit ScpB [Algicola sagamiensis]